MEGGGGSAPRIPDLRHSAPKTWSRRRSRRTWDRSSAAADADAEPGAVVVAAAAAADAAVAAAAAADGR